MAGSHTTIGVLAVQGDFREHCQVLHRLATRTVEVRLPRDLDGLDGLIIPGGESTTISKLMHQFGLVDPIRDFARVGHAVWGTCAGMIIIGRTTTDLEGFDPLGLIDIHARRNAFGRQIDSFEEDLLIGGIGGAPSFRGVFIRAPGIERLGESVEVLATGSWGAPVVVRQGAIVASTFHPELTTDTRFHEFFVQIATAQRSSSSLAEATPEQAVKQV